MHLNFFISELLSKESQQGTKVLSPMDVGLTSLANKIKLSLTDIFYLCEDLVVIIEPASALLVAQD